MTGNSMLWKKAWWETHLWFYSCLGALIFLCLLSTWGGFDAADWAERLQRNKTLTDSTRQALNTYQGMLWAEWFKLILPLIWAFYAGITAASCHMFTCPFVPAQGAIAQYTLSLPATRHKMLLSQAALVFGWMTLVALIPSLLIPLIARFHGQWFSWKDAAIYSVITVFGGAVFFGFSFLLAVVLRNWAKAFAIIGVLALGLMWPLSRSESRPWWHPYKLMSGESYFYHGRIPWLGLLLSLTLAAMFVFIAVRIFERRDL